MKSIKNKIFKIIQPADNSSILSKMFDLVIVTLILINTVTIIAATFSLSALKIRIFLIIEIVSVIIFSVEYIGFGLPIYYIRKRNRSLHV